MELDKDLIRELAALLIETGLSEIEIGEGDQRIRVARTLVAAPVAVQGTPSVSKPAGEGKEEKPAAEEDVLSHPGVVTSPMVGTVYMAPEPGAPPFVKVGDEVREGQTLLIVEAKKTMNPILAPRAGRVTRILVENAQPVEYDEVLMIIEQS